MIKFSSVNFIEKEKEFFEKKSKRIYKMFKTNLMIGCRGIELIQYFPTS